MHVFEIYEDLRKHFNENEDVSIPITLEDVSRLLMCSKRNANFALKRLVEKNWITWIPGRGRGNVSTIAFHFSIQEMYVEVAKEKVQKHDISGSLKIIENHVRDVVLKQKYFHWLNHSFGMSSGNSHNDQQDTLRVPVIKEMGSLDPILTTCGIEAHLVRHIFDTLVEYNSISNCIEPCLAHHWDSINNYKEWIFYLRKGVQFHDGSECSSKDVEYTFQRVNVENSIYRWMTRDIVNIKTPNKWTVQIELRQPNRYFLHYVASHPLSIISKNALRLGFRFPIGTGPFKVITNDARSLLLSSNTSYFRESPFLDKVELWKVIDHTASSLGMRPDSFQLERLVFQKENNAEDKWDTANRIENGCKLITFNLNQEGPQQNKWFRKAISVAINRSELVRYFPSQTFYPAHSLLPSEVDSKNDDYEEKITLAQKYLKKSGYAGEKINLYCSVYHEKDAELLKDSFSKIGVQMEVIKMNKTVDSPYPHMENPHLILYECLFDDDLTFSLLETYMTEDSYIRRNLSADLMSVVQNKINSSLFLDYRNLREALDEIEDFLLEENAFICLYRRNKTIEYSPELRGIQIDPLGWVNFKKIWSILSKK